MTASRMVRRRLWVEISPSGAAPLRSQTLALRRDPSWLPEHGISFNHKEFTTEPRHTGQQHKAWNKGRLVGQKAPFKLKEIWAIRVRLEMQRRMRESALFNLGIDSKLRACD